MEYKRCWAEIDLGAISENYRKIRETITPGCKYLAVVKADGYGHGAPTVANLLQKEGADWFGVATLEEALRLRKSGIIRPILVLGYTDPAAAAVLSCNTITQTLLSEEYARELAAEAEKAGCTVDCHIKIDTGMCRLGFEAEGPDTVPEIVNLARCGSLNITGIFTHFSVADDLSETAREFTHLQFIRFARVCNLLKDAGVDVGIRHCCNSAATLLHPEYHLDMCRIGISQYGLDPDPCIRGRLPMKPVMSLYTVVTMVKDIPAGSTVSYGRTYTAPGLRSIATVAIGYADGYPRGLSDKAYMLLHGKKAPVIGRICMDQLMLDVTEIPEARAGDRVTVVGQDGELSVTFDDLAGWMNTINYEVVCGISKRIPRLVKPE